MTGHSILMLANTVVNNAQQTINQATHQTIQQSVSESSFLPRKRLHSKIDDISNDDSEDNDLNGLFPSAANRSGGSLNDPLLLEDKYNWAITCKSTFSSLYYDPIKNYQLLIVDDNYPRDAFIQNIQSIKFQSNRNVPDFRTMQAAIHFFRKLKVVDISSISHSAKQAATVLKIVPENLTLLVRREDKKAFEQNAVCVQKKITVELYDVEMRTNDRLVLIKSLNNSLQKRPREGDEDDQDEEQIEEEEEKDEEVDDLGHRRKRQRTPSPVREIIALELAKVAELKKRLCEAYSNRLEVPHILREVFRVAERYELTTSICTEPVDIGNCIDEIANNLIHAIVTTKEGNWVFITQVEIYVKDTQVDDVAIVSKFDKHPSRVKVVFEKLAEGRGSWCELRVMYHHYEVLVTGATTFSLMGASIPFL